VFIISVIV